jgi:hypothetical protein
MDNNNYYTDFEQVPVVMDAKILSKVLGISLSKSYELFRSKGFPCISLGKRKVVPKDKFVEWLNKSAGSFDFYRR